MSRHKRRRNTAHTQKSAQRNAAREPGDSSDAEGDHGPGERLQKVLAAAGVGSRRDCEAFIQEGRIEVDRKVVTELGTRVDPLRQEIRFDGEALRQPQRLYYAVNKPVGVVTTNDDPSGRPRVIDLVPTEERVFAVGRLDLASEGLILVTNDGEFANRITHPRYGVEKTYLVRVAGSPSQTELARLTKGVYLSDGYCRVQSISVKKKQGQSTDLVMVLDEGRNRELRRVLARVGHKVLRLKRIAVGSIKLADQPTGAWRRLMPAEIESLLALAKEKRRAAKTKKKPTRPPGGMKPVLSEREESPYLQQQALMAEPLSLDDLLRDDLEEGNLAEERAAGNALRGVPEPSTNAGADHDDEDLRFSDDAPAKKRGGVINYEGEEGPPGPVVHERNPRRVGAAVKPAAHGGNQRRVGAAVNPAAHGRNQRRPGKKPFRKPAGQQGEKAQAQPLEPLPRESFGKKRGGKRVFSQPSQGRGPAGKTGGNFEFRAKGEAEGRPFKARGKRYAKPTGKTFAKPGGKKFGKPAADGKSFGKPSGGKKFGKPGGGKSGGGKLGGGKPGGKRKGRR